MDVKIDVSENVRFQHKPSYLAVATDDGKYKLNVGLPVRVKEQIPDFQSKVGKIHCILIYLLIKDELSKYDTLQIDNDIGRNDLKNNLDTLFRGNIDWINMVNRVKVSPVHHKCFVDKYVKNVRTGKEKEGRMINLEELNKFLLVFQNKRK